MLPRGSGRYWQKGDLNRQWQQVAAADIVGAPLQLIAGGVHYPLQGQRFHFWNTVLWLLVFSRDLARFALRPLPRLAWVSDKRWNRAIATTVARIRKGEASS
jgi:hypothetical protein